MLLRFLTVLTFVFFVSCAKRGTITGGEKDTIAPILIGCTPKNLSANFKGNVIKLNFNEFVKLKDVNKQLIVSPPMQNEPLILPTTASKYITIKIRDTLKPNTTYSFNFGQSIRDNNEDNSYNQFKYVFSTGSEVDSLTLSGTIKDAYEKNVESFISIMLYEVNDKFKDSIIYKKAPNYITNTLDSMKTFRLENLKAGKYFLVALKDNDNNNLYNPKIDKIGFHKNFIKIPNDSLFELKLFKEKIPFIAQKPFQSSNNKIVVPYEGKQNFLKNLPKVTLKNGTAIVPTIVTQFPKKDSLQIWYKPIKVDSLETIIEKDQYKKNFIVKIKKQKKDTLNITCLQSEILNFREKFTLETTTPLVDFKKENIKIINKTKTQVPFKTEYDVFNQRFYLDFKKEPSEKYEFTLLPGALTDFFGKSNDTLTYKLTTKNETDYGNLYITLLNVKQFPVVVELSNNKGEIIASESSDKSNRFEFNFLEPENYTLKVIYDDNKNGIYDSGNYLEKTYAEEVIYFSESISVRANWEVEQTFDLNIPYTPESKNKKKENTKKLPR